MGYSYHSIQILSSSISFLILQSSSLTLVEFSPSEISRLLLFIELAILIGQK